MSLLKLLDRPIAFHRCFVQLTGSVPAALMLSQAVYWQQRCPRDDGWWWKTAVEWEEETGLKRDAQLTARKLLARHGFWQEKRRGIPAKAYFRIDFAALVNVLNIQLSGIATTSNRDSRGPGEGNSDSQVTGTTSTISETTAKTTSETTPRARSARAKPRGVQPKRDLKKTPVRNTHERLSCELAFGFDWEEAWSCYLAEDRAVAIFFKEGVREPGEARRIIAEWASCGARGFLREDPAATLIWCCRNRGGLGHTAAGDEHLPRWS